MKKYIWFILLAFLTWYFFLVQADTTDFLVKKTSSWDETYWDNISDVSTTTSLTFQITSIWWVASRSFQVSLPSGFTYNNNSVWWTCTTNITTNTNSNLNYNFSWVAWCVSIVTFSYNAPSIAWNYSVDIIENSSLYKSVSVWVVWTNTISSAVSKDQDNDWYIDWYLLTFQSAISNASTIAWLTVWWQAVTSYVWDNNSWIINFTDWVFGSWDLPQILSTGWIFWNVWTQTNTSVIEQDWAKPVLLKVNSTNVFSSSNASITTWNVVFEFSEPIHHSSQNLFEIKKWTTAENWTYSINAKELTFTPTSWLAVWNYNFNSLAWVKDLSDNQISAGALKTLILAWNVAWSCTWLPSYASWNSASSINQYWDWTSWTPASLAWSHNTTASSTECRYKCNNWYNWDWTACIAQSSWWWGWGWWAAPLCLNTQLECKLYKWKYIWVRKAWVNCNWWNLAKTCSLWTTTQTWATSWSWASSWGGVTSSKDMNYYISKVSRNWVSVYRTNNLKIKDVMLKIENIILTKFDKLLANKQISTENYNTSIENYNNFVLYLSIYRDTRSLDSKTKWKYYLAEVIKTYNIKLIIKKITLVWDVYTFTKDLKIGDYNDEVRDLQTLLKHYNYFPFEPTWYFWNQTSEYLKKFCSEVLYTNFNWIFNSEIREKINNLEY